MKIRLLLALFLLFSISAFAQDTILVNSKGANLNQSIANQFHIYEVDQEIPISEFVTTRHRLKKTKLTQSVANLDFTTKTYFILFVIDNRTNKKLDLFLETARPITNDVTLYNLDKTYGVYSGDQIPFSKKTFKSNLSILPLSVDAKKQNTFILRLGSDGEIISLPMTFWNEREINAKIQSQQFYSGLFYGIFLFVIIIYFTFFLLLKDRLFLLYTVYVIFSGLLQFALDGYIHQFVFPSGGYMTQHSIIFIAGGTVFFALTYASRYLELTGRTKLFTQIFLGLVVLVTVLSIIPGGIYASCYPLCNGFSLIGLLFMLVTGIRKRRNDKSISPLFMIGLTALLTGAVIFILGNFSLIDIPALTQNSLKVGTLVEIICLSILMAGKYKGMQDEKNRAQQQLMSELEEKNRIVQEANIRLEQEVADRTREIELQRLELKEKNDDFISSIKYAERIQTAILPHDNKFKALLPDSFVLFKPKDIVSGDFYWIEEIEPTPEWKDGLVVYATADCTGHGVPGAFVSIVCSNLLKLGKTHKAVQSPGQALDFVNHEINDTLNSEYSEEQIRDGMDVALCALDRANQKMYFAGAKNGLYIIRNGEIIEYKGNRKAIGNTEVKDHEAYKTHEIDLQKGDVVYSFTDGIVDQFGGPKEKKFMSKRLKELLISIANDPMEQQKEVIENAFNTWKGDIEQIDDVLVIGVRI